MAGQSRRLRNGLISLAIFFALVAALLLAVPGLRSAGERITDANVALGWRRRRLRAALLRRLRGAVRARVRDGARLQPPPVALRAGGQLGRVGSGIGGIALGRLGAAQKGVSVERIAKRSVLMFVLTSAVNVSAGGADRHADVAGAAAGLCRTRC